MPRRRNLCKRKKNVQNFCRRASLHISLFKLILHTKAKAWVFVENFSNFYSHFIGCGGTNCSKSWIQLWSNTVHYYFCFLKSGKLLKIRERYSKLTWKRTTDHYGSRTLYLLIFHSEATWTSTCIFPFYFKSQSSNFSMIRMKQDLWSL